jgi:hypothetical protein
MIAILDIFNAIGIILHLLLCWRIWVCLAPAMMLSFAIIDNFNEFSIQNLFGFGILAMALIIGLIWEHKSKNKNENA